MVHYKASIPLLVAMANQDTMPHASGGASGATLRQHSEAHLAQYFQRLFEMREEKGQAGYVRVSAFNALLGYSGMGFSEKELAAISQAVPTEAEGKHDSPWGQRL